jgi:hypothetical protein
MRKKEVLLSEADFIKLIKRIVKETKEAEMEEGWLGDKMKGMKRFATGYGDESEKSTAKENFKNDLKRIEKEVMMDIEDFVYEDEGGWEMAKQDLKDEAEENNYLGRLKIMHPRRTGKSKVMYIPGKSEGGRMMSDIGAGAAGGVRSGYSQTKSN